MKHIYSPVLILLCLAALCAPRQGLAAEEPLRLDITATVVPRVTMAVPPLTVPGGIPAPKGEEMAALLRRGLAFHGFIQAVDPQGFGENGPAEWKTWVLIRYHRHGAACL